MRELPGGVAIAASVAAPHMHPRNSAPVSVPERDTADRAHGAGEIGKSRNDQCSILRGKTAPATLPFLTDRFFNDHVKRQGSTAASTSVIRLRDSPISVKRSCKDILSKRICRTIDSNYQRTMPFGRRLSLSLVDITPLKGCRSLRGQQIFSRSSVTGKTTPAFKLDIGGCYHDSWGVHAEEIGINPLSGISVHDSYQMVTLMSLHIKIIQKKLKYLTHMDF